MEELQFEQGHEHIPTRDEVLEVIARYAENAVIVRELSDEQGLYLLEAKIKGRGSGEVIQYEYMRRGRFPNHNQASETAIHVMYYQNEEPVGGDKITVYTPKTEKWEAV